MAEDNIEFTNSNGESTPFPTAFPAGYNSVITNPIDGGSTAIPFTGSNGTFNPNAPEIDLKFKSKRRLTQKGTTEILRYPVAEIHDTTDYLQIKVVRYKTIPVNSGEKNKIVGAPGSRRNSNKEESLATIFLPIPSAIQDRNSVSYQSSNINAIAGTAIGGIQNIMEGGANFATMNPGDALRSMADTGGEAIKSTIKSAGGADRIVDLITKSLASQALGVFGGNVSVDQLLARGEGIVFNPNMELLFNGPSLRSFAFSFQMTPRSQTESDAVKSIIRTFKSNMAPQVTTEGSGSLFLKTPNVFELTYKQGNQPHSFLHQFKQCFLENVSVNYTGAGTYATYGDGTPVSIIMNLQFKEIEPIYDIDYENEGALADGNVAFNQSTGVGY
jgi:hypothetical protein